MHKSILDITGDLIRIRSTADRPADLHTAVDYCATYFSDLPDIVIRRYEYNGKPSIVVSFDDAREFTVMMVGHLDVVPAALELFEPRIVDGQLLARGACDMKSEVAVMLEIMRDLHATGMRPSVALMLTTDEETSGRDGTGYLTREIGYRCRVALVPDSGETPEHIVLKSKGVLHLRIHARGLTAHGSRPWLGVNAIESLFETYQKIKALFPPTDDPDRWYSTCIIGTIAGGSATNQIPDCATGAIDIRFTEQYSLDELLEKIRAIAGDAEIEILSTGAPMYTDMTNSFVMLYAEAVRGALGVDVAEEITHGATDGRFFAALGIPVITSRPCSGGQHSPSEWLDIASLGDFKKVYAGAIEKFLSV